MESFNTGILAALASVNALQDTVEGYKSRDKTLGRLQSGLEDLTTVLGFLKEFDIDESPILTLLNGPMRRDVSRVPSQYGGFQQRAGHRIKRLDKDGLYER